MDSQRRRVSWSVAVMLVALGSGACASEPQALLLDHLCDPDFDNEFEGFIEPLPPPPGPGQPVVLDKGG